MQICERSCALIGILLVWVNNPNCEAQNWPVTAAEISPGVLPYISVAAYGAKGDGITDDTQFIQAALTAASTAGGGIVVLNALTYNIIGGLQIPQNVTLSGVWHTPSSVMPASATPPAEGTTLLANIPTNKSLITIASHGTLEGIAIYYPQQVTSGSPQSYNYCIQGLGPDVTIQNILLCNPYEGIDLFTNPSDRHIVRSIYGQPLHVGIYIDNCASGGHVKNINFWPAIPGLAAYIQSSGHGIVVKQTDQEVIDDVFINGYYDGIQFNESASGVPNGQLENINLENCNVGILVADTDPIGIHISNLSCVASTSSAIGIYCPTNSSGYVCVTGASFYGSTSQGLSCGIEWNGSGDIRVENSYFGTSQLPSFDASDGQVILTGNCFQDTTSSAVGINITSGCTRALITGNDCAGNQIVVNAAASSINGNLP